jgi:hypothetical protein
MTSGPAVQWRDAQDYREFQRQLVCYLRRWSRLTELIRLRFRCLRDGRSGRD